MALTILKKAVVVVFDICSSTEILIQLSANGEEQRFWHALRDIKRHLVEVRKQKPFPFNAYKFTGDGWILIFPSTVDGEALLAVLRDLCVFYKEHYLAEIEPYLDVAPESTGLTFGIAKGTLAPAQFFGKEEYIGLPLVVATRLQGAIKHKDGQPGYKMLCSKSVYKEQFSKAAETYKVVKTKRDLHNIGGGAPFECMKVSLLSKPAQQRASGQAR